MNINRAVLACRAAILAGALALAGGASAAAAQASASAAHNAARIQATPAVGPVHGTANLDVYSINSDGAYFRAVLSGSIGDYGPATAIYPDGQVDPEHNSELELSLSHGSFRLNVAGLDQEFIKHLAHYPDYPATCSEYVSFTARVPVVAGSGTGSYRGITGDFTLSVTGNEALTSPGSCTKGPWTRLWEVLVFAGPGTLSS
jgi:hypothetical protein